MRRPNIYYLLTLRMSFLRFFQHLQFLPGTHLQKQAGSTVSRWSGYIFKLRVLASEPIAVILGFLIIELRGSYGERACDFVTNHVIQLLSEIRTNFSITAKDQAKIKTKLLVLIQLVLIAQVRLRVSFFNFLSIVTYTGRFGCYYKRERLFL